MKRALCYLPENMPHHVDHLVPLAIELDLPIITHCERQSDLISCYYPQANLIWVPPYELFELASDVVIISTLPRKQLELALFLEMQLYGSFESVFCPHGLSDKEFLSSQFEELALDRKILLYGEKMRSEITSSGTPFSIGNYRRHHFESHKTLYFSKLQSYLSALKPNAWKLLWAPTWIDRASQNHELEMILESSLLSSIPDEIQVIFKPHPNLIKQIPTTLRKIQEHSQTTPGLYYLEEVPYIYPLFEKIDAYLGDTSSIGYDFLTTLKPIFSLSKQLISPWQKIALEAPLKEGGIDWDRLLILKSKWDSSNAASLLQQGFANTPPLRERKEDFYEYLNMKVSL